MKSKIMVKNNVYYKKFCLRERFGCRTTNVRPYLVKRCSITSTVPSCEGQKDALLRQRKSQKKSIKIVAPPFFTARQHRPSRTRDVHINVAVIRFDDFRST